jgi:hypothetical protein
VLFFDNTCGAVICSECWDYAKDASDKYDHYPYQHAKRCAEAYAEYDDGDEAAEFRLSVRTAVIVDGAPLEESALVAAAQELFKGFSKERCPAENAAQEAAQNATQNESARQVGRWKSHDCSMDYSQ